jgi:ATP-dependent DNA helicase RecG
MDKFRDQAVIDANLFQQLQAIEDFCRKHMFMSGDQDQFDSKNVLTVPLKVVREAALNLLIHRTWWSEGRTPSVNIFDDRVEFMNPGAFPPGTTPADFRHRPHSVLVNEVIANALFKGGKTEGWGRGILDIFTLCKEAGLPEPEYDFVPNFVCLTIRFKEPITPHLSGDKKDDRINDKLNDRLNEELSAPVRSTYLLVRENPGIQRKELSKKSGKSVPTIDRHLAELQEKGFVVHEGSRKTGGYYAK